MAADRWPRASGWSIVYAAENRIAMRQLHAKKSHARNKQLLIEPCGVLNTGHEGGERTAENDVWI